MVETRLIAWLEASLRSHDLGHVRGHVTRPFS